MDKGQACEAMDILAAAYGDAVCLRMERSGSGSPSDGYAVFMETLSGCRRQFRFYDAADAERFVTENPSLPVVSLRPGVMS